MVTYDATGWEPEPFDGRVPAPTVTYASPTSPRHGDRCRPANPEIGCVCGEDLRQEAYDELHPQVQHVAPGQWVNVYAGVPVEVLEVVDVDPLGREVLLRYRRHFAHGHMDGQRRLLSRYRLTWAEPQR